MTEADIRQLSKINFTKQYKDRIPITENTRGIKRDETSHTRSLEKLQRQHGSKVLSHLEGTKNDKVDSHGKARNIKNVIGATLADVILDGGIIDSKYFFDSENTSPSEFPSSPVVDDEQFEQEDGIQRLDTLFEGHVTPDIMKRVQVKNGYKKDFQCKNGENKCSGQIHMWALTFYGT